MRDDPLDIVHTHTHTHSVRRDSYLHCWKVPPSKAEWVNSPQGGGLGGTATTGDPWSLPSWPPTTQTPEQPDSAPGGCRLRLLGFLPLEPFQTPWGLPGWSRWLLGVWLVRSAWTAMVWPCKDMCPCIGNKRRGGGRLSDAQQHCLATVPPAIWLFVTAKKT